MQSAGEKNTKKTGRKRRIIVRIFAFVKYTQ